MGVYINSTAVILNSTVYTLAGYTVGTIPTDYGKIRTTSAPISKTATGYTKPTKPTTPYAEIE